MTAAAIAFSEKVYAELNQRNAAVQHARSRVGGIAPADSFYFVLECYRAAGIVPLYDKNDPLEYLEQMLKSMHEVKMPEAGDAVSWRYPHCCGIVIEWPRKIVMSSNRGIVNMVPRLQNHTHRFFSPWA